MEIKNKALVKHEIRNIWPMLIYFMGWMLFVIYIMSEDVRNQYLSYMRNGGLRYSELYFGAILNDVGIGGIYCFGIGVVLLVYLQFKDNKSLQISVFLKSLPYTQQEVYRVKIVCGILTITVPMLLGSIGILSVYNSTKDMFTYMQKISAIGSELVQFSGLKYVLTYLLLSYMIVIFMYVFGFLMQYLVNNNVASLIISGLVLVAPTINIAAYGCYIERMFQLKNSISTEMEALMQAFNPLGYLSTTYYDYRISDEATKEFYSTSINVVEAMGIKLLILLVFITTLLMAIHVCKVGVVISCIGVTGILMIEVIGTYSIGQKVIVHIIMLIVGAISYLISNKICLIGRR